MSLRSSSCPGDCHYYCGSAPRDCRQQPKHCFLVLQQWRWIQFNCQLKDRGEGQKGLGGGTLWHDGCFGAKEREQGNKARAMRGFDDSLEMGAIVGSKSKVPRS